MLVATPFTSAALHNMAVTQRVYCAGASTHYGILKTWCRYVIVKRSNATIFLFVKFVENVTTFLFSLPDL
jgi:hypothetical protein